MPRRRHSERESCGQRCQHRKAEDEPVDADFIGTRFASGYRDQCVRIQGTRGIWMEDNRSIYIEGCSPNDPSFWTHSWESDKAYMQAQQTTSRGYYGGREYDLREAYVRRRGESADLALGQPEDLPDLVVGEAAALRVPVPMSSLYSYPGSRKWQWASTSPGTSIARNSKRRPASATRRSGGNTIACFRPRREARLVAEKAKEAEAVVEDPTKRSS